MIEALKSDEIVNKVGGRFKLTALIQKRALELMNGARPLVEHDNLTDLEIVVQEILQDKIFLDASGSVLVYEVTTKATVELQGNQIDFAMTRRGEISEVGKAKVEIPEGVQKLLDNKVKSEDKKE